MMNNSILLSTLLAALFLTACDKPVVVNVPAETIVVPGPAGPAGEPGAQGADGNKGDAGVQGDAGIQGDQGNKGNTGDSGENTTVIITPPAEPAPAN